VRLTSTVAEYQALASIEDYPDRLKAWTTKAWTTEYEAVHRDVFDVYYRSYSDPCRRTAAVADVSSISPLVREPGRARGDRSRRIGKSPHQSGASGCALFGWPGTSR
jgi:hypothetical protein